MSSDERVLELADRQAIQDLVFNYAHGLDRRDETLFAALWAPDATWHFVDTDRGEVRGLDAIVDTMRSATASGRQMHHFSTNLLLRIDGDHAWGTSTAVTSGAPAPFPVSYRDEYVRLDGGWRFRSREVRAGLPEGAQRR